MRKAGDFVESYVRYAHDGFVPDRFHRWCALSVLAGAIERKIALKQGLIQYVPNLFVMLVSHPKGGKSTAIARAVELIEGLRERRPNFRILPNQMTEPAFVDLMKIVDRIPIPGTNVFLPQSAGYFYASEASSSALKDPDGFIVSAFTDFWDCPKWFRKKLKTERDSVEIENACLNLLAGTTFHFLRSLVNEHSVLGGFASRLIYVVSPERKIREGKWENGHANPDFALRDALLDDLEHIHQLVGPMKPSADWIARYEQWAPGFDRWLHGLGSERLEGIYARKDTNLIKVSMLLSISESDSLRVEERHFDQALELIEDAYKDNTSIVAAAVMADKTSQSGINIAIGHILRKNGGKMNVKALKLALIANGNPINETRTTFEALIDNTFLHYDPSAGTVSLLGNPDGHL